MTIVYNNINVISIIYKLYQYIINIDPTFRIQKTKHNQNNYSPYYCYRLTDNSEITTMSSTTVRTIGIPATMELELRPVLAIMIIYYEFWSQSIEYNLYYFFIYIFLIYNAFETQLQSVPSDAWSKFIYYGMESRPALANVNIFC